MDEFAKMDIFFVVTTIAVALLGVLFAIVLYRAWRILGHVERFMQQVNEEAGLVRHDIARARAGIGAFSWRSGIKFLRGIYSDIAGRKKKTDR